MGVLHHENNAHVGAQTKSFTTHPSYQTVWQTRRTHPSWQLTVSKREVRSDLPLLICCLLFLAAKPRLKRIIMQLSIMESVQAPSRLIETKAVELQLTCPGQFTSFIV